MKANLEKSFKLKKFNKNELKFEEHGQKTSDILLALRKMVNLDNEKLKDNKISGIVYNEIDSALESLVGEAMSKFFNFIMLKRVLYLCQFTPSRCFYLC